MNDHDIRSLAIEALAAQAQPPFPPAEVTDHTPITAGGLGLTSVGFLHAFVTLEERLGLHFDDTAVFNAKFVTVGDFIAFLHQASPARSTHAEERAAVEN
jgi:acyl carrier protein